MPREVQAEKGSPKKALRNAWALRLGPILVYTLTIASSIFPIFYSAYLQQPNQLVSAIGLSMKPNRF